MVGAQNGLKQKWKQSCKKQTKNKYICPHLDNQLAPIKSNPYFLFKVSNCSKFLDLPVSGNTELLVTTS